MDFHLTENILRLLLKMPELFAITQSLCLYETHFLAILNSSPTSTSFFVTGSYAGRISHFNLLTICVLAGAFFATNCFFSDNAIYMCIVYGCFYHSKPINTQTYGSQRN